MATRTPAQIAADILAKLRVTAPGLSLEVGTPERKLVDAVAEALAESQVDNYLNSTALDIDTKSGADLEDYVGIFGFGRLQGTYAAGEVTVTLNIPAIQDFTIPAGSQFFVPATPTTAMLTYSSTSTVAMTIGDVFVIVPLRCSVIGTLGNVTSNQVTSFTSGQSFSASTNISPFTGGTNSETDEQLRSRFKKTVLRNIAGTQDFYSAICLQVAANGNTASSGVSRVQVLGPVSKYLSQIGTGAIGTPVTVPSTNTKYVWPNGDAVSTNAGLLPTTLTGVGTTASSTALTAPAGSFSASMVNSFIYGAGVPAGATLATVTSDTAATSSIASTATAASIALTVAGESWFTNAVDYNFSAGAIAAPVLTPLNAATANAFLDVTYEYTSTNSRNDPVSGKTNKVDIFVDGQNPQAVTEQLVTQGHLFTSTPNTSYSIANFAATDGQTISPALTFQRLGSTPILSWPTSILLPGVTKILGTDYIGVYDKTTNRGSEREISGIWWTAPGGTPADGIPFVANYTYNQTPQILNSVFKKAKQITTDVLVHQAVTLQIGFHFIIQYNQGYSPANVNNDISSTLNAYMESLPFGAWIQFSDIVTIVHNVSGVDNVRMAKAADGAGLVAAYQIGIGNVTIGSWTSDFQLSDNTLASLYVPTTVIGGLTVPNYAAMFTRKTSNTFGS